MRKPVLLLASLVIILFSGCNEDPAERVGPLQPADTSPTVEPTSKTSDPNCVLKYAKELSGISNVGILLVEFSNTDDADRFSVHDEFETEIETIMFSIDPDEASVHNLYQEMSYGADGFTGGTIGIYELDASMNDVCSSDARYARNRAAYDLAVAAGETFEAYDLLMYVYSIDNVCAPLHLLESEAFHVDRFPELTIPEVCMSRWSWSRNDFAHEIGHLFGYGHSTRDGLEYGDLSCCMGDNIDMSPDLPWAPAPQRHLNVCWKLAAEYIGPEEIHVIDSPVTETVYLAPNETAPADIVHPAGGTAYRVVRVVLDGYSYYLSYRQPEGPFYIDPNGVRPWNAVMGRVLIHKPRVGFENTGLLAALEVGEEYVGADYRISVVTDGLNGPINHAEVLVETDYTWPCEPDITLSCDEPVVITTTVPHRLPLPRVFTIDITEGNVTACTDLVYQVTRTATSGGSYFDVFAPSQTITLDGGETVTSPTSMTFHTVPVDGQYTINFDISRDQISWTQDVSWIIDSVAPTAPGNVTAMIGGMQTAVVDWTASVDATTGVDRYEVERNGEIIGNTPDLQYADATIEWNILYTYRVRAVDGAGHVSAWSAPASTFFDTTPPTVPGDFALVANGCDITLSWSESFDELEGVDYYEVRRNGTVVDQTGDLTWGETLQDVPSGEVQVYDVRAVDGGGMGSAWTVGESFDPGAITITFGSAVFDPFACIVTVSWTTDVPSTSVVHYGETSVSDYTAQSGGLTTNHVVECDVTYLGTFTYEIESGAGCAVAVFGPRTLRRSVKCFSQ